MTTPIPAFEAVPRQETLTSRVVAQIESYIHDRHLQPGDRLPPERELASQFGVSRTVIREAVAALTAKSLLEGSAGGGTTVRSPSREFVSQSLGLYLRTGAAGVDYAQVHEVRRLLEVEIAGLAAARRSAEDLSALAVILDDAAGGLEERARFVRTDVAFHAALADATQNPLFRLLHDSLAGVLAQVRERGFTVPGTPARALGHHRAIFAQVQRGDVAGAREAMRAHLAEAEETQRRAMAPEETHAP